MEGPCQQGRGQEPSAPGAEEPSPVGLFLGGGSQMVAFRGLHADPEELKLKCLWS